MEKILRRLWHIFRSQSLEKIAENAHATHLPVLIGMSKRLEIRKVLEFGSGINSTLLFLNRKAFPKMEEIVSYENNLEWFNVVKQKTTPDLRVKLHYYNGKMKDCANAEAIANYDLIFIDDSTTAHDRAETIKEVLKQNPKLAIIHDFETFAYRRMASRFCRAYRFKALLPNVGVCGNFSVAELKKIEAIISKNKKTISPDDISSWLGKF